MIPKLHAIKRGNNFILKQLQGYPRRGKGRKSKQSHEKKKRIFLLEMKEKSSEQDEPLGADQPLEGI